MTVILSYPLSNCYDVPRGTLTFPSYLLDPTSLNIIDKAPQKVFPVRWDADGAKASPCRAEKNILGWPEKMIMAYFPMQKRRKI